MEWRAHYVDEGIEMNKIAKSKIQHNKWNNIWCLDTISNSNYKDVQIVWILNINERMTFTEV